ncbi:polar amino acid transport system permease protein [Marmoricola sp. URHA0025 HA25]
MKRSTKRRLTRLGLYALLVAVLVVLGLAVDWSAVRANFWGHGLSDNWHDLILTGVVKTLEYTAITFAVGLAFAIVLALMKLSPVAPYRWLATIYVELFRGLPAILVIFAVAFGVPIAFSWSPPGGTVGAGLLGLILVASAYMAETLRAGIQAVPKGQTEAARSLGMGGGHTLFSIVLPQAFRIVIPPMTNEFVLLLKDTSLLFILGVEVGQRELASVARDFTSSGPTAGTSSALTQAALLYLIITLPLTRLVAWLEKRQQRAR